MTIPPEGEAKHVSSDAVPAAIEDSLTGPTSSCIDESDFVTVREDQDLQRGLQQRHVGLIAIAGAIVRT